MHKPHRLSYWLNLKVVVVQANNFPVHTECAHTTITINLQIKRLRQSVLTDGLFTEFAEAMSIYSIFSW